MTNLSTYSTVDGKVKKYNGDYSLDDISTAFEYVALECILNLNEDEIEEAITNGPMDGGIDAVYINGIDVHIFNFEYARTFENSKNNFPEREINNLLVTMARIYNKDLSRKDVNQALWEKVANIWELFDSCTPHFKYYLCSNKQKPVSSARLRFEKTLNPYIYVEYYYYDQEDLVSKILERKFNKIDGEFSFLDKEYFERTDGPLRGIVATMAATDLINLVTDPNDSSKIMEDVFNENVRVFLKLKNRINRAIFDTALSQDNFEFWYLNNGITIVCDECNFSPHRSPKVKLTNLQIVNGGQTTHALFEAFHKDKKKLEDVLLLVRICETKKDYLISEKISETTNSQNPIRSRDLHANDRIQRKLEDQFKNLDYYYERKKNQHHNRPKWKRLDNELIAQIYLAYYLDMPSEAKDKKVLVFGEMYDQIFNEDLVSAERMLLPYKVYLPLEALKREIQRKKRKREKINEKDAFISRATFHLLNAVKIISERRGLDLTISDNITIANRKAIKLVGEIVKKEMKARGELYTHDKFFKEVATNETIKNYVVKNVAQKPK